MFAPAADEQAARLALLRTPGIGAVRFAKLVEHCGSATQALAAGRRVWEQLALPPPALEYLRAPDWQGVEHDLQWLQQPDNHLLALEDADYPPLLRRIPYPPPLLFVCGDPTCLHRPQLAMVGSRNPTRSGAETAQQFATHLAALGMVITSGLAMGIDAAAHQGALEGGGHTIAVTGTSLERVYPARHRELAHAIAANGALISEFPLGTPPIASNFPQRNRIISGLSLGVLVVEAAAQSGSLITAHQALEQGREVFAIPGSIHNPLAKGCHALIRQGAKLVETAADILEELGALVNVASAPTPLLNSAPQAALDAEYLRLLEAMGAAPSSIDLLVERCALTAEVVSSMLLILELEGYVAVVPGGLYSRL